MTSMQPISRRQFLTAAGTVGAAVLAEGFVREPRAIEVTRHEVPFPGLPVAFAGLRIACLTDVHLHGGVGHVARAAVEHVHRERPDIVVLAGDICNEHSDLPHLVAWTRDVRGTVATFATLGNWEHHAGIDRRTAERAYEQAGVELLYNSATRIRRAGETLTIVGIDDPVEGEPDLGVSLATVGPADRTIWVVHAPGYVDRVPAATTPRPAAILTGHTHGGQIRLPFYTPYVPKGSGRFVAGWYHDSFAPLYVSRGIGTVFLPARLFCPPELPVFTLRPAS
jgi:uncharacterized protein